MLVRDMKLGSYCNKFKNSTREATIFTMRIKIEA